MKSSRVTHVRAGRCPRPANIGLRNGARRKLDSRDRISLSSTVQSVSAIAYPFDFRDCITITDASLYAIRSISFDRHIKGKEILPAWRFDK